jgi:parallel beta-helix repeat protein
VPILCDIKANRLPSIIHCIASAGRSDARFVQIIMKPCIWTIIIAGISGIALLTYLPELATASNPSPSKDLYLAVNGIDAGNCAQRGTPCRTFEYVDRHASPGMVVHVAPGTYNLTPATCIVTNTSDVTWQSDVHGAATINGGGKCLYIWHNNGPSGGIKILGFQFTGVRTTDSKNSFGVLLEGCKGGFEVAYNIFHDFGTSSSSNTFGAALSTAPFGCGVNNYTGRTCSLHDNIFYHIAPGGAFHFNGYSIYAICDNNKGADADPTIYNNLIYDEGSIGIHLWHAANHTHIYNNTIDKAYMGILVGVGDQGATDSAVFDIANNIVSSCRYGIYAEDASGSRLSPATQFRNNLVFDDGTDWGYNHNGSTLDIRTSFQNADNISGNPLYVNREMDNFAIKKSSPAVGKGLYTRYTPSLDLLGATRPDPPSIGALEPPAASSRRAFDSLDGLILRR